MSLQALLPVLLPKAIRWAEENSALILARGVPLPPRHRPAATRAGVQRPDDIRLLLVPAIPMPADPQLAAAAAQTGLIGPHIAGMTLGYGIFVRQDADAGQGLIAHECRHVYQYEWFGSIAAFLGEYLQQIVTFGYRDAPLEIDARRFNAADD